MTTFAPATPADRDDATAFVGRIAQLDPASLVRMIDVGGSVELWAKAGFGVLATRSVPGRLEPSPATAHATNLVGALAVSTAREVDPGSDAGEMWHAALPPHGEWRDVGELDAARIAREVHDALTLARVAVEQERENEIAAATKATVPPALLDSALMSVPVPGARVPVSMRMLFALSGMGFVEPVSNEPVRVQATATWLRLETQAGGVARRRMADLPPN